MTETLLFSPMTIRGVTLKNRIVVPPMHQYSAVKGFPTDWHLMNAGKFAAGGAGLVVVESTKVERRGCGTVGDLGIWDDGFVEPLGRLVKFIRQQNSVAGIQLGHSGRKARASRPWEGDRPLQRTPDIDDWDAWSPVAPSAWRSQAIFSVGVRFDRPAGCTISVVRPMPSTVLTRWAISSSHAVHCRHSASWSRRTHCSTAVSMPMASSLPTFIARAKP